MVCKRRKRQVRGSSEQYLPHDIIFEILSWLPVESLLRFKAVCKKWGSMIDDSMFIDKHMSRARHVLVYTMTNKNGSTSTPKEHLFLGHKHGLVLQQGLATKIYRLRNPCTRQCLDLPAPSESAIGYIEMCYIPFTREFKLVHSYGEGSNFLGCKILTAGTDAEWRSIDIPLPYNRRDFKIEARVVNLVYYIIFVPKFHINPNPKVACLDMQNEQLFIVNIPWRFFLLWDHVMLLEWQGKLSLAGQQQDGLHFWVLENYREQKWGGWNIIKQLTSVNEHPEWQIGVLGRNQAMVNLKERQILCMNSSSGKTFMKVDGVEGYTFVYRREPSLVRIKGMQPESEIKEFKLKV